MKKLKLKSTEARTLYKLFLNLPTDSDGFIESDFLEDFRKLADKKAISRDFPYGRNSIDPTIVLEFKDGSRLLLGNPRQCYYKAICREYFD